jgi:hypothetical protein
MTILLRLLLFLSLLIRIETALSQNNLVKQWDYRFGGNFDEVITCFNQTSDKGFIIGGYSYSGMTGDKSQPNWAGGGVSPDYWIVKTDSLGVKQWDKRFGGTAIDCMQAFRQTSDGGYILGGYSNSYIGGDKTQAEWGTSFDYWIVKIDSVGVKQWDYRFGGTDDDQLYSIWQTNDGGYLLGGFSNSDISGDKTQTSWGGKDYWVVKTDSLGIKQWDKRFGGIDDDEMRSLQQTADGDYILGGHSISGISGDKTQASRGDFDYWMVKINQAGIKLWDRRFGGSDYDYINSLQHTSDKGYILGGFSNSPASGDKTMPLFGAFAGPDFWIAKTDSLGILIWDKDIGGIGIEDEFGNVSQTSDGGYLLAGSSYSPISGEKSEDNLGQEQTWAVKTDSSGIKQWDKTLLTPGHDEIGFAVETYDGCFAFADYTDGNVGGYKTQPSWNNTYDYWIIKFCDSVSSTLSAAFTGVNMICPGTCTDFINLSQGANSYLWLFPGSSVVSSSDANPVNICYNTPGSYDVTLIAGDGNSYDTLIIPGYVTVYPSPPPQSIMQSGDTLIAIQGAVSYQWYHNGNMIPGATDYFYVAQLSGDYNVVTTDINGCEVEAVIYDVIALVETVRILPPEFSVLYNKETNTVKLFCQSDNSPLTISLFNSYGAMMYQADIVCDRTAHLQMPRASSGLYLVCIISKERIYNLKIVVE